VSFQTAVTTTEYLDGIIPVIALNSIRAKSGFLADMSKVLRPTDILGVPQAIKGFDKSDFRGVI
jgi:hypothetical protein